MYFLDIFSDNFLVVAETLAIVVGSMLMGILLSYFYWGSFRKQVKKLSNSLDLERDQAEELKSQLKIQQAIKGQLQNEITEGKSKLDAQSKKIFDQQQSLFDQQEQISKSETNNRNQKAALDELNSTIDTYQHRLRVIEDELLQSKNVAPPLKKVLSANATRANYEHVSQLLGRQVTENDLTLIIGIGPKTAALLHSNGIQTWDDLAKATSENLSKILSDAGGIYKSIDPAHWARQAAMAASSEWRKLRVFQETLRKSE
ncbi:MAG: helix-hairpin-helix domain-containing protein [Saprospiraceae bacterium]